MSLSGLFLIAFLTMHLAINLCMLWGPDVYNVACEFMGTNPFVKAMVPVLAGGFFIHIIYAFIINVKNSRARGSVSYASRSKSLSSNAADGWASRNMLVLGIIVLGALGLHLAHFWSKMQLQAFSGGVEIADPYALVVTVFQTPLYAACYLVWFVALWFHLNHGFWSAFQSVGVSNEKWLPWLRRASIAVSTVLCGGFALIVIWSWFL